MRHYDYYRPETLEEVFKLKMTIPGALYISGGTDLMVRIKKKESLPRALISLRSVRGLSGIENGSLIRVGAMTTVTNLIKNTLIHEHYPVLIQAANAMGNVQIRNVATIGGNICNGSPAADMALPLLVLEAKLTLQNGTKSRNIPLEKFFLGPGETCLSQGEILTHILLEPPAPNTKAVFMKKGRTKMDLAVASVAVLIRIDGSRCLKARIAAGSAAPIPTRLIDVETLLEGSDLSPKLLAEAQQLACHNISPVTDIRSTADYRRHMVGVLVRRALEKITNQQQGKLEARE